MFDTNEFLEKLKAKKEEVKFHNPESDIGEAFNDGLSTMMLYAHSIALKMVMEEKAE